MYELMDSNENVTEYKAIDVAKLFFCVCIVFLHSGAYHLVSGEWWVLHLLLRLPVPFFFVVSGFFWGRKIYKYEKAPAECLRQYEMRLLQPYIVFSLVNIFFAITEMAITGEDIIKIIMRVGRSVLFYPYGALWYVWASIVAVFLLYFFVKKDKLSQALMLGGVLYLLALLMNSYYFLIEGTWFQKIADLYLKITTSAKNGVFVGFLFVGIGIFLAKKETFINEKKGLIISIIVLVLSYALLVVEVIAIRGKSTADDHSLFFAFVLLIPSLVIVLLHCRTKRLGKDTAMMCRNLSTGVYYLHRGIMSCVFIITALMGNEVNRFVLFFGVMLSCLALCICSYKSGKNGLRDLLK